MSIQCCRAKMRAGFDAALIAHLIGDRRPDTAVPRVGLPAIALMDEAGQRIEDAAAREQVEAAKTSIRRAKTRRTNRGIGGRKPVAVCGEWVFAGVPPGTPPEQVQEWATASVAWLKDRLPAACRFAVAALHWDEASPHCHVLLGFESSDGLYGWNRVQRETPWSAGGKYTKGDMMSRMQDDYHSAVASRFGIERGKPGRGGGDEPIDRSKSLASRLERAEQELVVAERKAAEAERELNAERERGARRLKAEQERGDQWEAEAMALIKLISPHLHAPEGTRLVVEAEEIGYRPGSDVNHVRVERPKERRLTDAQVQRRTRCSPATRAPEGPPAEGAVRPAQPTLPAPAGRTRSHER